MALADDLWKEADPDLRSVVHDQWTDNGRDTRGIHSTPPDWAQTTPDSIPIGPFCWDEDRRAILRAELDAYYARLYGLTRDELRYILGPKDVYGPDFPGETFRVLKEKEERTFGEYRTRRLVLEAWDRLEAELGPVVVRNYREEMARSQESGVRGQGAGDRGQRVAEGGATYQATVQPAAPPVFGATQAPPPTKVAPAAGPDLFTAESNSGRTGVPPQGRPAPTTDATDAASTEDARPQAPQTRPRSPEAEQPVLIPSPPQGNRSQRLSRLLALGRQRTPEAIGELVAALGDEDEQLRWLAALSLQGIGGGTVIATLKAFIDQAPSAIAREEAEKVLGKLTESGG